MPKPPASLESVPVHSINLDHRTDRWNQLVEHCAEHGLQPPIRHPAVNGKATTQPHEMTHFWRGARYPDHVIKSSIGTAKSFHGLLAKLRREPPEWTLITEDDVEFQPGFAESWSRFASGVPEDALICALGGRHKLKPIPVDPGLGVYRVRRIVHSTAFLVHRDAIQPLHSAVAPLLQPFDQAWNLVHAKSRTYMCVPHLAVQRATYSDIQQKTHRTTRDEYGPR
jgi:hypothetical protein